MQTVNEAVLDILKEHPHGLTRECLLELIQEKLDRPVGQSSMKLGMLALAGKVGMRNEKQKVTVERDVPVYFLV